MRGLRMGLAVLLSVLLVSPPIVVAQGTCSPFRTWASGDSLTASDLNSSVTTLGQTNMTPGCLDDSSSDASAMNTTTDPNSSGTASLPTTLTGELQRIRHVLKHATGWTQWWTHYEDVNLANRMLRLHQTTQTSFKHLLRGEAHLSASSVRFHLVSFSIDGYLPGTAHPESVFFLLHAGTTVSFKVGLTGDVHVGSTLGLHAQGTAAFPTLVNLQDTNTGLFFPAADAVAVTTGGSERARVDAAGRLGIGVTNPTDVLHVAGAAQVRDSLHVGSAVGIGVTPTATLHVAGSGAVSGLLSIGGLSAGGTALASILHAQTTLAVNNRATVGALTVGRTGITNNFDYRTNLGAVTNAGRFFHVSGEVGAAITTFVGLNMDFTVSTGGTGRAFDILRNGQRVFSLTLDAEPVLSVASPGARDWQLLTAVGDINPGQVFRIRDETASINRVEITAYAAASTDPQFVLRGSGAAATGNLLNVVAATTNHLAVLAGGNVLVNTRLGVGVTAANEVLHVVGSGAVQGTLHAQALGVNVAPTSTVHVAGSMAVTGIVNLGTLMTTGSAGSKAVVCVDTSNGRLYASSTGTDCSN